MRLHAASEEEMSMTAEKPAAPKSAAGNRAAIFKPKKQEKTKPVLPDLDSLAPLPEEQFQKLTVTLKDARHAGEKIRSQHGKITKDMRMLRDAVVVRMHGDIQGLRDLSLSNAMLVVYRTSENVDETFGKGTFVETKRATGGGASLWRKQWGRVIAEVLPENRAERTPEERFAVNCVSVANSKEVPFERALLRLKQAYGVK